MDTPQPQDPAANPNTTPPPAPSEAITPATPSEVVTPAPTPTTPQTEAPKQAPVENTPVASATGNVTIPLAPHSVAMEQKPVLPAITKDTPLEAPHPLEPKVKEQLPQATQSGAAHVDLGQVLLPKKEVPGHTVLSAQRVNASVLLEQEVVASTEGTAAQKTPEEKIAAAKPKLKPLSTVNEDAVPQLETYQKDIERVVQNNNTSVLDIASAEANRKAEEAPKVSDAEKVEKRNTLIRNTAMIVGGVVLLIASSGVLAYYINKTTPLPATRNSAPNAPFISVDEVKDITISNEQTRAQVLNNLDAARQATSLSLGLMSQLLVTEGTTTAQGDVLRVLPAQEFFNKIAPNMPVSLARALKPSYLLGVHVYNDNQAFLIASVYSYEQGYSGMLAWEQFLTKDLYPLFKFTPRSHIPEEGIATSAPQTENQVYQSGFVDKIVENNDARVLLNEHGDVYLMWTFIDRNTLVIATNEATLREVLSRLKNAPITPVPGQ